MIFMSTAAQLEKFFKMCMERNANTEEERLKIMAELVKERNAFVLSEEQLAKRLSGKKALQIKAKKEDKNGNH